MSYKLIVVVLALALTLGACHSGDKDYEIRKEAYQKAKDTIQGMMTYPETTRFPELPDFGEFAVEESLDSSEGVEYRTYLHDSVTFTLLHSTDVKGTPYTTSIIVTGYYWSRNSFEPSLLGHYTVFLTPADYFGDRVAWRVTYDWGDWY